MVSTTLTRLVHKNKIQSSFDRPFFSAFIVAESQLEGARFRRRNEETSITTPSTFSRVYRDERLEIKRKLEDVKKFLSWWVAPTTNTVSISIRQQSRENKRLCSSRPFSLGRRITPSPFLISSHSPTSAASGLVFCGPC